MGGHELVHAGTDHLDELYAIELRAAVRPWQREVLAEELTRDQGRVVLLRPVGDGPRPAEAFIAYYLVPDELHILNIATDPAARRRGHAARLLEHAVAVAKGAACTRLLLEVRRSNEAAIRLYRKYGFRPVGIRAGYYAEEHEDALVMALALT